MSKFKESVLEVVSKVPPGSVASYGQIALYVGAPRAARQVGWILNGLSDATIPWWRVINNSGRISIKGSRYDATEQKRLLEKEGIKVNDDFTLDIEQYRFKPDSDFLKKTELDQPYLKKLV